jgi:hypothetical protein
MKKKEQTNIKKIITFTLVLVLLCWIPLKAEKNNEKEVVALTQRSVFTLTTSEIPTPLEKPTLDASTIYELPKNTKTYDFTLKPIQLKTQETKYPETYKSIKNFNKVHVFEKSLFEASLIANVILNAADYFSTREALKYDGLQEGNPFMKPFVKDDMTFAAVKIGLTVSNYFVMKKLFKRNKTLGWIVSIASNLALSYVVSTNMNHIYEARNR